MRYGRGPLNKYEYACTRRRQPGLPAAAAAGRGGLRGLRRRRAHDRAPAHQAQPPELDHPGPGRQRARANKTDLYQILRNVAESYPRRGHDGAGLRSAGRPRRACSAACGCCGSRGHDVLVFHVLDDDELDFPFNGPTRFEGLELPEQLALQSPGAARGLPGGAATPTWRKSAAAARGTTSTTPCSAPASRWTPPWPRILSNRLGMHHRTRDERSGIRMHECQD